MTRFSFPDAPGDLLGAHISTKGGLPTAFERAAAIEASAMAIWAKNSNQWVNKPYTDALRAEFAARRNVGPVITHASYLITLATTNDLFHRQAVAALIDELDRAEQLGLHAVVLHPGAHLGAGARAGLDQIARSLDAIHAATSFRAATLLETAAGQGSCVGCTFQELGHIIRSVDDRSRVGICIDTCHIFAAGYDIRTREGWERAVDEVERYVGIENVGAFHRN